MAIVSNLGVVWGQATLVTLGRSQSCQHGNDELVFASLQLTDVGMLLTIANAGQRWWRVLAMADTRLYA